MLYHVTKNLEFAKELMRVGTDLGRNTEKMGSGFYMWTTLAAAKKYAVDPEFKRRDGINPYIMVFDIEPQVDIFDIDYEINALDLCKFGIENAERIAELTGTNVKAADIANFPGGKFYMWNDKKTNRPQFKLPGTETLVSDKRSEIFYNILKKYPELEHKFENDIFKKMTLGPRVALQYTGPTIKPKEVLDCDGLHVDVDMINERMLRLCGII